MADPARESAGPTREWTHIGDGVYAAYDGYHVWISLQSQPPRLCEEGIALEPGVLTGLMAYARRVTQSEAKDK